MASPNQLQNAAAGFHGGGSYAPVMPNPIVQEPKPEPDFAADAQLDSEALTYHNDALGQRMQGTDPASVPGLDTPEGQVLRGYANPDGSATEDGELFLTLLDRGLLNKDGTQTQKGQAFTLPEAERLNDENYELWKIRQQHELDDTDLKFGEAVGGVWDMVKDGAAGAKDIFMGVSTINNWDTNTERVQERRMRAALTADAAFEGGIEAGAGLASGASAMVKGLYAKAKGAEDDYYRAKFAHKQLQQNMEDVNIGATLTDTETIAQHMPMFDISGRRETADPAMLEQADERGYAFGNLALDPSNVAGFGAGMFIAKGTKLGFGVRLQAAGKRAADAKMTQTNAAKGLAVAEAELASTTAKAAVAKEAVERATAMGNNPGKWTNRANELEALVVSQQDSLARAQGLNQAATANLAKVSKANLAVAGMQETAQQMGQQVQRAKNATLAAPTRAVAATADKIGEQLMRWDGKLQDIIGGLGMQDIAGSNMLRNAASVVAPTVGGPVGWATSVAINPAAYAKLMNGVQNFSRILGEELVQRRGTVPFWQRVANNSASSPLTSAMAHTIDNALLGSVGRKGVSIGKDVAKGSVAALPTDMAFEVVYSGGEVSANSLKQAAAESLIFGGTGGAAGSVVYGTRRNLQTQQLNDELTFREQLPEADKAIFQRAAPGVRKMISTAAAIWPALDIKVTDNGASSFHRQTNTLTLNTSRGDAVKALLAHELGHYMSIKSQSEDGIKAMLLGTEGNPGGLLRGENGELDPSFTKFRDAYNGRMEAAGMTPLTDSDMAVEYYVDGMTEDIMQGFDSGDFQMRAQRSTLQRAALDAMRAITYKAPIIGSFLRTTGSAVNQAGRIVPGTGVTAAGVITQPGVKAMVDQFSREQSGRRIDTKIQSENNSAGTIPMEVVNSDPLFQEQLFSFYKTDSKGKVIRDDQGNPVFLDRAEINQRAAAGLQLIEMQRERVARGEMIPEGELQPDGSGGLTGTFLNPAQVKKLQDSGFYNAKQIAALRQLNRSAKRNLGETFMVIYQAATRPRKNKAKGYATLPVTFREIVPTKVTITKDGNILIGLMSVTQLTENIRKRGESARGKRLYGGDMNKIMEDVHNVTHLHRDNKTTDEYFNNKYGLAGREHKNFINTVFGLMTKAQQDVNPMLAEDNSKYKDNVFKTYRLDRINQTSQIQGRQAIPFDYESVKANLMPQDPVVDSQPAQSSDEFIESFVEAANDLTSFQFGPAGNGVQSLGGFDTSFHVTTKIKHLLGGMRTKVIDRAIANATKRGDADAVARWEGKKKKVDGVVRFLRGKFADYVSNFPDKAAIDLRTGKPADPYQVAKEFFPDGEPGHIEDDIREIALAVKSVKGSAQDVLNLTELAEMNGVELEDGFKEEQEREWLASRNMTPEQFKKAEADALRMVTNPEFNDVTEMEGGGTLSTRIDPEANLMPEAQAMDAAYAQAVESEDVAKQQEMVDEAAKAAGYVPQKLFHGSPRTGRFDVFDPSKGRSFGGVNNIGSWFTTSEPQARKFGEHYELEGDKILGTAPGEVYSAYVKRGRTWKAGTLDEFFRVMRHRAGVNQTGEITSDHIPELKEYFRNSNISTIEIADTSGDDLTGTGNSGEYVVALDPSQIKSADPITYDKAGNVIPLSERFNEGTDNINYMPEEIAVDEGDSTAVPLRQAVTKKGKPKTSDGSPVWAVEPYNFTKSPLAKTYKGPPAEDTSYPDWDSLPYDVGDTARRRIEALIDSGSLDEAVRRLVAETKKMMKRADVRAGAGWYSRMRVKLLNALGEDGRETFSQLLGATSAKTPVDANFEQARDAYEKLTNGDYANHIAGYQKVLQVADEGGADALDAYIESENVVEKLDAQINELVKARRRAKTKGLTKELNIEIAALRKMKKLDFGKKGALGGRISALVTANNLLPLRSNGKKFNANSRAVLKVLAGTWLDNRDAPKTPNFAGNLAGRTIQATIDVWAGRTLREITHRKEMGNKDWRIQQRGEGAVSNEDFAFGQIVFERAAKKLKMNPDDLQAIVWFGEKHKHDENGWTGAEGKKKSSFDDIFGVFFPEGQPSRSFAEGKDVLEKIAVAEKAPLLVEKKQAVVDTKKAELADAIEAAAEKVVIDRKKRSVKTAVENLTKAKENAATTKAIAEAALLGK